MTLSLALLLASSVFILPAVFLSLNRLRFYLYCAMSAFFVVFVFLFFDFYFPSLQVEETIGRTFSFLSSFILNTHIELSIAERYHISFYFFLLVLYFLVYLITYIILKVFYIGANPSVHKNIKQFRHLFDGILFLIFTYGMLALFFIEIRQISPFKDGLFAFFFNWIHPLEA